MKAVCASFLLTMAILTTALSGVARSQDPQKQIPDVQQLKDRVKQLEDTVDALKAQITVIENAEKSKSDPAAANRNVAAGAPKTNDTAGVYQTVGYDPNAPASTAKPAKKDTEGENTFEVYGFAMLDTGYQFGQNHPDWFDVVRPTKLPSFHDEFAPSGKVFYGVRQSRMGFKSSTPTKWGELKTIFEFELFGTGAQAGQTIFRLRHAYGELGHFGAGQYWTTFGDTDAYPNTIEYWGPNGLVWFRNVQVRWMPIKGRNSVTIALERPGASGDQGNYADRIELSGIKPRLAWPDLAGNVRFDRNWGHIQISGLLRSIRWTDTNNSDNVDLSGSAVGGGVSFSSHFNFGKKDIGRFQFTYGTGIENYMNDAPADIGVKNVLVVNPQLGKGEEPLPIKGVALPVFGMSTFLDHTWSKKFSSSFGFSMIDIGNSDGQAPSAFHRGMYALGNLLWYPVDHVTIGSEFQWGNRQNFTDGFSSQDFRMQFSFKYNFSKMFKF